MPDKALRKERPTTVVTRDQSFLVECIKSLVVIFFDIELATAYPFHHLFIVCWLFGHRSPDVGWLLSLNFFPFLNTLWYVDIYGCCSVLLPADVADYCFRSFRYVECLLLIDHSNLILIIDMI